MDGFDYMIRVKPSRDPKKHYTLCRREDIEAALELEDIRIPNTRSVVYIAGRSYKFRTGRAVTAEKKDSVLAQLSDCGELEFDRIP